MNNIESRFVSVFDSIYMFVFMMDYFGGWDGCWCGGECFIMYINWLSLNWNLFRRGLGIKYLKYFMGGFRMFWFRFGVGLSCCLIKMWRFDWFLW